MPWQHFISPSGWTVLILIWDTGNCMAVQGPLSFSSFSWLELVCQYMHCGLHDSDSTQADIDWYVMPSYA